MHAIWTFALAFWLFWFPQFTIPQHTGARASSGGGVTWTLIQHPHNFTCSTTGACSVTLTQNTVAGDAIIMASAAYINTTGANPLSGSLAFSSASGDSTWTHCPSGVAASYYNNVSGSYYENAVDCATIASATGGASTASFTWSWPTGTSPIYYVDVEFVEIRRSTGTPSVDVGNHAYYITGYSGSDCAACALPALSITGSSDYILGWGTFGNADPTGPGSPWTNPADLTGQTYSGYIGALNQSSGPASVNLNQGSSDVAITAAIALK